MPITIAIDGPAGAGKSTTAKRVAAALGIAYVDSGALYRTVTYAAIEAHVPLDDPDLLAFFARNLPLEPSAHGTVFEVRLRGHVVGSEIRTGAVSREVAKVSQSSAVRKVVSDKLRALAREAPLVMDGRDIGSVVLPDAELKIFLTAPLGERARRRHLELRERGEDYPLASIEEDVARRDFEDESRPVSPLLKAADAVELSTEGLTVEQVTDRIVALARARLS